MEIRKGYVYLANLDPRYGTEPGKLRPVVVIQTEILNQAGHSSTIVCPITSKIHYESTILRVHLKAGEASLHKASDIMVDQIWAIDNSRFKSMLGFLHEESLRYLKRNLKLIFDF